MNRHGILLWGFAATLILTTLLRGSRGLGLTRMDIPFMLGTMVTPDRSRAKVAGFGMHLCFGWLFASIYALYFDALGFANGWLGAAMGLFQGTFVLVVLLPLLPGLHPRMVSDFAGPEPTRQLEPPGFLGLNYGYQTPLATLLAHLLYGTILGAFYRSRLMRPVLQPVATSARR
ncbi:MAG TPA: hypothetical protein VFZ25_19720 [Chloroflexota bacterium]|nr:hypothetical protein [Chloroflexota bacterium]